MKNNDILVYRKSDTIEMYIYGKNVSREKINSGEKINKIYLDLFICLKI